MVPDSSRTATFEAQTFTIARRNSSDGSRRSLGSHDSLSLTSIRLERRRPIDPLPLLSSLALAARDKVTLLMIHHRPCEFETLRPVPSIDCGVHAYAVTLALNS